MLVRDRLYDELARIDGESRFEIHDGRVREKPSMTYRHGNHSYYLGLQLGTQLDRRHYEVRVNHGRVRLPGRAYYIPDVMVIPTSLLGPEVDRSDVLEIYDAPLPLVAEVWSPTTGDYDVMTKLPVYRRRGDREIWLVHPFDRILTAWQWQPDGSYTERVYEGGVVEPLFLPGVRVDLDLLFI